MKKLVDDRAGRSPASTVSNALCEHFELSPGAAVRRRPGARSCAPSREIIDRHGTGRGCDICRPVVASILASLGTGARARRRAARALQDTNDHVMANLQKDGTYSVVPRIPGGEITPRGTDRDRPGRPRLRALHEDHRRPAHRPVRRPARAAAGDLAAAGRRRLRVGPRLRQVAAHREVVRRVAPGAGTACRTRWRSPSPSSCATAVCARRTRSSSASPAAPASAPRPAARTSA